MGDLSGIFSLLSILILSLLVIFPIYVLYQLAELRLEIKDLKQKLLRAESGQPNLDVSKVSRWAESTASRSESAPAAAPFSPVTLSQFDLDPHPVSSEIVTYSNQQSSASQKASSPLDPISISASQKESSLHYPNPASAPEPKPEQAIASNEVPPISPDNVETAAPLPEQAAPREKRDLESLVGANWLAKLGVAAIAVAAAFFLQYAFRAGWIGPLGQVGIGLSLSAVMLGIGQYLQSKERYRNYAHVLSSGGIIVYFLVIYAAYGFYNPRLLGYGAAFSALIAGALAASLLAIKNRAEIPALLCVLGAFMTPVLIREGGAQQAGGHSHLYFYLIVLNVWVAILTRLRPWYSLSVVAFAGTWLLFFGAGSLKTDIWQTESCAALFLLAFCYLGIQAMYPKATAQSDADGIKARTARSLGVGLIVLGCFLFEAASITTLSGFAVFGLQSVMLSGILLVLLLTGLASSLPSLGSEDASIRKLFGYLASAALAISVFVDLTTPASPHVENTAVAFSFTLFNYLLFLTTALTMHRRTEAEAPAIVLAGTNVLMHVLMVSHILASFRIWNIPCLPIWMPIAGLISFGGLWIANRQRADSRNLPKLLIAAAYLLPLYGVISAFSNDYGEKVHWPVWSLGLIGFEFVMYSAAWLVLRRRIAWLSFQANIVSVLVNAFLFFAMMARVVGEAKIGGISLLACSSLVIAVYHAVIGMVVLKRDTRPHRLIYLGLSITFFAIAVPLQLKASFITLAWAAEAAILVWTGLKVKEIRVRRFGMALLTLSACKALFIDLFTRPEHFHLFMNSRTLAGASVITAAFLSAWWMWRRRESVSEFEQHIPAALSLFAHAFVLLFISFDLWDFVGFASTGTRLESMQECALTVFWSAYAIGSICFARRNHHKPMRQFAVAILFCTAFKALLIDASIRPDHIQLFINLRMLAGAMVILTSYIAAWLLWQERGLLTEEKKKLPARLLVLANAFTLLFVSLDLWDFAGVRWPSGDIASAQQLALSLFWTVYAMASICVGIWKRVRTVRLFAMGLLYISIGKVFLFDLRNLETLYRIASFFTLGVILLLVSLLYTRFEERLHAEEAPLVSN